MNAIVRVQVSHSSEIRRAKGANLATTADKALPAADYRQIGGNANDLANPFRRFPILSSGFLRRSELWVTCAT